MKVHVHFNLPGGQTCVLDQDVRPGHTVTCHVHNAPNECEICPNGHCHAPNVNLTVTESGEIFLAFENLMTPCEVDVKELPPHGTIHKGGH